MSSTKAQKKRSAPQAKKPEAQGRKFPVWWIVGGVVAVALIAAMVLSFGGFEEDSADEFGTPTVTGTALATFTGEPDAAAGTAIPEVSGADFDGNTVEINQDGTAKAIVFLAHWCPHCQTEVPRVQEWIDSGGLPPGVELVSVSTSMSRNQPNYPASDWLEGEGWTTPLIVDNEAGDVHTAYGNGPVPYWVFVDADGNVVARTAGELPIEQLDSIVNALAG